MKRGQIIFLLGLLLLSFSQYLRHLDSWLYPIVSIVGCGLLLYGGQRRKKEGTIPSGSDRKVTAYWLLMLFGLLVILAVLAFFSERRYWVHCYSLLMVWEAVLYWLLFRK